MEQVSHHFSTSFSTAYILERAVNWPDRVASQPGPDRHGI